MFANSSMKQMYIYFIKMWNSENKRLQDLCVLSQKKIDFTLLYIVQHIIYINISIFRP